MKEKIELMLKVYRERLEKAQRQPIDHVLGLQTQAQISILESLYIYALQEEKRANKACTPTVLPVREIEIVCPNCNLVIDVPVPAPHSG